MYVRVVRLNIPRQFSEAAILTINYAVFFCIYLVFHRWVIEHGRRLSKVSAAVSILSEEM